MSGNPTRNTFQRVYEIVGQIPSGQVATYGQIASMLGNPRLSRVVGYALHVSPADGSVHWYRVVNRFGGLYGAAGEAGADEQRFLLEEEGVEFTAEGCVVLEQCQWDGYCAWAPEETSL